MTSQTQQTQHLVIIRGSPGVGKTTLAKRLAEKLPGNVSVVSIDALRYQFIVSRKYEFNDHDLVYKNIEDICKNTLQAGLSVIVEGLLASKDESGNLRIDRLQECASSKIKVSRIFLLADENALHQRLQQKPSSYQKEKVKEWTDLVLSTITSQEKIINTTMMTESEVLDTILKTIQTDSPGDEK